MLKIYITNLGKYNEGELIGEWVELPKTDDELEEVYKRIGINDQYEEMFITDYETDIPGLSVSEYESIDELNEKANNFENYDDDDMEIIGAFLEEGYSTEEAIEKFDKGDFMYYSDCNDMEDVAMQYAEGTGLLSLIPENLQSYFDFKSYGRDMSYEGHFIFTDNGCVEIF